LNFSKFLATRQFSKLIRKIGNWKLEKLIKKQLFQQFFYY
jgi:hypothetical protein